MFTTLSRNAALKLLFMFFLVATVTGCGSGQPPTPTLAPAPVNTLAPTSTPTPAPTHTNTPLPTATLVPSPTAIPLPKGISDIVSNAVVKYQDTFDTSLNVPKGWGACSGFEPVWSLEQSHLAVSSQTGKYGTLFYFDDEMIHPNEAVYFLFAFEGNQNEITLGFDGYDNGKVCDSNKNTLGFYSVALEDYPGMPLTIHSIINTSVDAGYFKGDWRLQEKSWYGLLMGFDQSNTFFMTIWKPGDPGQKLVFQQAYPDFPKAYNFISWTGTARKVWLDDFSILTFDAIQ